MVFWFMLLLKIFRPYTWLFDIGLETSLSFFTACILVTHTVGQSEVSNKLFVVVGGLLFMKKLYSSVFLVNADAVLYYLVLK